MLSFQTVVPHTLELLKELMKLPILKETRLVGGTALALQYGHRNSVDLDLFGDKEYDIDELSASLMALGKVEIGKYSRRVKPFYIDGVKIDIVDYKYKWIDDCVEEDGIRLASPKDIASFKVNAIQGRGTKKDFVDMFFLLQHYSLDEIMAFYHQKYPEYSDYRAMLSLTYFNDAEPFPMPIMFSNVSWEHIKETIKEEVVNYNNNLLSGNK